MTDINKRIAEWMGWKWYREGSSQWTHDEYGNHVATNFTKSLDSCALFEAEIEDRNLWTAYRVKLEEVVNYDTDGCYSSMDLITATPTQRCQAWERTIEGAKDE